MTLRILASGLSLLVTLAIVPLQALTLPDSLAAHLKQIQAAPLLQDVTISFPVTISNVNIQGNVELPVSATDCVTHCEAQWAANKDYNPFEVDEDNLSTLLQVGQACRCWGTGPAVRKVYE